MNTKYVFLDVDGTLVNFRSIIPDSAVMALTKARKNGHKMILATGRQKSQIYPELLSEVKFDGMIASSGAYIEAQGKEIFRSVADREHLEFVVDYFHRYDIPFVIQSRDAIIAQKDCVDRIVRGMGSDGNCEKLIHSVFGNVLYTDSPEKCPVAEKIAYYNAHISIDQIRRDFGDYYSIVGYSLGSGSDITGHGEINFDGINKAGGISRFMAHYGASVKDSIAIGDSENDLTMICRAGVGVAMGNSDNYVKEYADIVTTSIDDDGIKHAFEMLGLI